MKSKLLILLIFPFLYGFANAQDSTKITYGIKFGLNSSSTTRSSSITEINKVSMKSFIAYNLALVVDIPVSKNWSVQPALSLSQKGQKKDLEGTSNDEQFKVSYFELPVNIVYRYNGFFAGAGPYIGTAFNGTVEKNNKKTDLDFGSTYIIGVGSSANDNWKRYDYGASMILGYKWKVLVFNINYDLGLKDIDPNPQYKSKTRTGSLSVGLMF